MIKLGIHFPFVSEVAALAWAAQTDYVIDAVRKSKLGFWYVIYTYMERTTV